MSKKVRVIVVDDSVVYRTQIKAALEVFHGIEIVGTASNGKLALQKLAQFDADFMTLDLEMPEMDGIQTLKEMRRLGLNTKVVVFSSVSKRGAEITMEALSLGASDFVTKPDGAVEMCDPKEKIRSLIMPKLQALFPELFLTKTSTVEVVMPHPTLPLVQTNFTKVIWDLYQPKIVVIGSSTGGPTVLERIFSQLVGPLNCPIVITQHMPPMFTATLAERLEKLCGISAKEAIDDEPLQSNHIYLAPGNYHLRLKMIAGSVRLKLDQEEQINFVRPAVDPLFQTAAEIFKDKCLGIVLTGMGQDGKIGAESIKNMGGSVVIQDEKSCVVFGMPGAVYYSGAFDKICTPDEIAGLLQDKVSSIIVNKLNVQRK